MRESAAPSCAALIAEIQRSVDDLIDAVVHSDVGRIEENTMRHTQCCHALRDHLNNAPQRLAESDRELVHKLARHLSVAQALLVRSLALQTVLRNLSATVCVATRG